MMKQTTHSVKKNSIISFSSLAFHLTPLLTQNSLILHHHRPILLTHHQNLPQTLTLTQQCYRLYPRCQQSLKKEYYRKAKNGSCLIERQGFLRSLFLPNSLTERVVSRNLGL